MLDDTHQAIGVVVGQRLKQDGIDDAEHRRGGSDAKGQVHTRKSTDGEPGFNGMRAGGASIALGG